LPLIMACLLVGGLLRSMAFSGVNAMAFGDVDDADSSQATSINAVAQRISMAMGVAIAGGVLEVSSSFHSGKLELSDFHTAFFIVSAISLTSVITFLRLPRDAGADLSNHRARRGRAAPAQVPAGSSD